MLKETKKDLFISFWQLLGKRNLLLFCSCNKVMFHYVCLSRSLWLGYVFMFTHPDQVVTAVTFSSLATKWIRFSEREVRKNYCKYIDIFMGIFDKLIFMKETWFFPVMMAGRIFVMLSSKIFRKVQIRNNSLGNCQLKFLKFSLKDFYDFILTSWLITD